jgi:small subunit ribosomal protein S1
MSQSDDFDDESPKGPTEFAKLFEESTRRAARKLSVGDKIEGEILVLGKEEVFVSTGTQNDGTVARRDLIDADGNVPYKVGDKLKLYVTQVRGTEVKLSPNPTGKNLADDLEDAFDMMLPVEGRVVELCKGGVRVSLKGSTKLAFCPISQLDVNRVETGEEFIGRRLDFRITQFSEGGRNIVVSRRKLLDDERELTAGSFLAEHKAGDTVPGKVARLEKFGAFIELAPGIDGMAHVSELAWSRVNEPSDVLTVGQEVQVKILKVETFEGKRPKISLSIKQTSERPAQAPVEGAEPGAPSGDPRTDQWAAILAKFPVGTVVKGAIERKEVYGVFVRLEPGVTGLLHKSQTFDQSEFQIEKARPGQEIQVQVMEIKPGERRISLGLPREDGTADWKAYETQQTVAASTAFGGAFGAQLQKAMAKKK